MRHTVVVFLLAFSIYWLSVQPLGGTYSPQDAYYNRQAAAWLNGDLHLQNDPDMATWDLTRYNGEWYVPFPPLPSIFLLPQVAFNGLDNSNTIRFSLILGAANVALVYLMLRLLVEHDRLSLRPSDIYWLTLFFALGTLHWTMTLQGTVWFLAQMSAFTFVAAAAVSALKTGNPWLTGAWVGVAMLGRPHIALIMPFMLVLVRPDWTVKEAMRWLTKAAVPIVLTTFALLAYNQARFDDWRDFGYLTQNINDTLQSDLDTYGQFNLHFLPRNLKAMVWATPQFDDALDSILWPDRWGMSLFLVSPPLLWLARAFKRSWLVRGSWFAVGLILVPLLTYYNTGWWQFGYRFSLDFMLPVIMLLAIGVRGRVSLLMKALIIASIFINGWGAYWFAMITGRV